jgi:hypothetical protein
LYTAIDRVKSFNDDKLSSCMNQYSSLKSNSSSDTNLESIGTCGGGSGLNDTNDDRRDDEINNNALTMSYQQHRANTTMHVCWHRHTSVSSSDIHRSLVNQLSGYLLRKFKNSNGWQKLWVVFTNFCLFFYKTYQVMILRFFFFCMFINFNLFTFEY